MHFSTNKPTSNVEYIFDFFTSLPAEIPEAEDIIQKFKVLITIDQDFIEENGELPFFIRGISGQNIKLTIEYSDYSVGRNLQGCVKDWVSQTNSKKIPVIIRRFEQRWYGISQNTPLLFAASSLYGCSFFFTQATIIYQAHLLRTLAYAVCMFLIGGFLSNRLMKQIQLVKPLTFIELTAGDSSRIIKFKSRQNKSYALLTFFGVTIIGGIVTNLFSAFLFIKLGLK